jgi:hypothetical protein
MNEIHQRLPIGNQLGVSVTIPNSLIHTESRPLRTKRQAPQPHLFPGEAVVRDLFVLPVDFLLSISSGLICMAYANVQIVHGKKTVAFCESSDRRSDDTDWLVREITGVWRVTIYRNPTLPHGTFKTMIRANLVLGRTANYTLAYDHNKRELIIR